jgi:spore coat protein A
MKFELPAIKTAAGATVPTPVSPRCPGGYHEYVWHCHILEHEEHDMMRPLLVKP